ncbi:putative nuclease HARBI1 [Apostichopus japonicus]|uniref:Putative nuclease HARBI1 n=1 Tax=Stichopus japonicus TaxID=307972 RepID=A0A2G8LFN1_STIJA|nr:putative nuclease HARBI1 [Apostichopus japonicus]
MKTGTLNKLIVHSHKRSTIDVRRKVYCITYQANIEKRRFTSFNLKRGLDITWAPFHKELRLILSLIDRALCDQCSEGFFLVAGFPQVVGAVDGTLIGIHGWNYGPDEYVFVSRKGRHAINVQLICSAKYKIINVVARWPDSTHDSRILSESLVGRQFEDHQLQGILLGDSGYPLQPWLMTPIQNPTTLEETSFNNAQTRTRAKIEQVNGQLKNKFRCLLGDGMQIEPERACDIIVACCILFNIIRT